MTVIPNKYQDFEKIIVRLYVRETSKVGSELFEGKLMQKTYPDLAFLDPVTYSYGDIEIILGQDAIRPLEYL